MEGSPYERRHAHPAERPRPVPRPRSGGDRRVGGLAGRGHRGRRPEPGRLPHAPHPRARRGRRSRAAEAAGDRLRQHHPDGRRARVPRRRGDGAAHHGLEPLERGGHGDPGQPRWPWRPHRHVRLRRLALRDRFPALLPRQGGRRLGRPAVHPGPRLPRHLRPGLPRWTAERGAPRPLPAGGGRRRPAFLPAPAPAALALGVPDRVHGPRPAGGDLPGAVQPLPAAPRHQGHLRIPSMGVPR